MMKLQKFLDEKHGKFIGRVYFLAILLVGNALIPIGAVMRYLHNGSPVLMMVGIVITVVMIALLSTPCDLSQFKGEDGETK